MDASTDKTDTKQQVNPWQRTSVIIILVDVKYIVPKRNTYASCKRQKTIAIYSQGTMPSDTQLTG